jgi:hypothetical protein
MEGVVNATPQAALPRERHMVPFVQESGWAQSGLEGVRETSHPPKFYPRILQPIETRYTD